MYKIAKARWVGMTLGLVVASAANAATRETFQLKTPRGVDVVGIADLPDSTVKVPAVVLAPGQGYHLRLPILSELAESLSRQGVAVFRFNWNYFETDPKNGRPSEDLNAEAEDLRTVLGLVKKDSRVDPDRIILAGKSLGSIVAYSVFQGDVSLKSLFLMTPVCTSRWDQSGNALPEPISVAAEKYPGLSGVTRPVVITLGNLDPLCSVPMLYDYLKDSRGNVSITVVGGDHSWNLGPWNDPSWSARNEGNVRAAVSILVYWVNLVLGK